ncbi:MAG: hypothetical protein R3E83_11430 [Burkholderiaceae bacterium]
MTDPRAGGPPPRAGSTHPGDHLPGRILMHLLIWLLISVPMLVLTIRGWASAAFIAAFLVAVALILSGYRHDNRNASAAGAPRVPIWLAVMLVAPLATVLLSQACAASSMAPPSTGRCVCVWPWW